MQHADAAPSQAGRSQCMWTKKWGLSSHNQDTLDIIWIHYPMSVKNPPANFPPNGFGSARIAPASFGALNLAAAHPHVGETPTSVPKNARTVGRECPQKIDRHSCRFDLLSNLLNVFVQWTVLPHKNVEILGWVPHSEERTSGMNAAMKYSGRDANKRCSLTAAKSILKASGMLHYFRLLLVY